jgi:8-oxo-dGTP diphosphatase
MARIASVLVYAKQDDEVLLIHRNKAPNLGLWIAPGGKVELDESPMDAAKREMFEETGLHVSNLDWKGFCTEVSPRPDWQWFLFIYVAHCFEGKLTPDLREGALDWVPLARYYRDLPIPQADAIFAPRILSSDTDFFHAKFVYDRDLKLVQWIEY